MNPDVDGYTKHEITGKRSKNTKKTTY